MGRGSARRLAALRVHLAADASIEPGDLFGGAGFLDRLGDDFKAPAPAEQKLTSRGELKQRIEALGLEENVRQLDEEGWTLVVGERALGAELAARLRARIMEVAQPQLQKKRRSGLRFAQVGSLPYHGRVFEEACQNESHMALLEYLCGGLFTIWQYLASVRGIGTQGLPAHNDLGNGFREPFPHYPEMSTSIFVTDEFEEGAGGT